jgi:hypothetical protein
MKHRPVHRFSRALLALLVLLLVSLVPTGNAAGQEPPKPPAQAEMRVLEELRTLQAALDKLHNEFKQFRTDLKTAQAKQEQVTLKYVETFSTTYLNAVLKAERDDAVTLLSKPLRDLLERSDLQREYAAPLGYAGKGFDGAQWKSWVIDGHDCAPNFKSVFIKGRFQGRYEQKDVALPFVLHVCYESESELWRVCLFRIDFKK